MTDPSSFPDPGQGSDALWTYCLTLYAEPGIAAACITLQDHHGVDVNLLLYACWAASQYPETLSPQEFERLINATAPWQTQVTGSIRQARRALKNQAESLPVEVYQNLRRQLLDAELDAEKIELSRLSALSRASPDAVPADIDVRNRAKSNMLRYLSCLDITPEGESGAAVDAIAAAAANIQERAEG